MAIKEESIGCFYQIRKQKERLFASACNHYSRAPGPIESFVDLWIGFWLFFFPGGLASAA
jgi:hypothetical protein